MDVTENQRRFAIDLVFSRTSVQAGLFVFDINDHQWYRRRISGTAAGELGDEQRTARQALEAISQILPPAESVEEIRVTYVCPELGQFVGSAATLRTHLMGVGQILSRKVNLLDCTWDSGHRYSDLVIAEAGDETREHLVVRPREILSV